MSLEQLKKIRAERVKRIYIELQRAKADVDLAENELHHVATELEDYKKWRVQRQGALFNKLQSDYFSADKLRAYNLTMEKLKNNEEALKEAIPSFEKKLKNKQLVLDKTKKELQNVNKDMEKVDMFIDMDNEINKSVAEKQEEDAADELSCFKSSLS